MGGEGGVEKIGEGRGNKKKGQSKFKNCALRTEFWMNIFSWLKTFLYIFFSNLANEYLTLKRVQTLLQVSHSFSVLYSDPAPF